MKERLNSVVNQIAEAIKPQLPPMITPWLAPFLAQASRSCDKMTDEEITLLIRKAKELIEFIEGGRCIEKDNT